MQWRRAFPNATPIRLTNEHRIFNTFFSIDLSKIPSKIGLYEPEYLGFFEDNDPTKRMVAIIDNYADVGEPIQFSDEGSTSCLRMRRTSYGSTTSLRADALSSISLLAACWS